MRILHIVPEFEEGGVERYVIQLATEQLAHGHQVFLATAGGRLESLLPREVEVLHLPVQRKNLLTGLYCTFCLAQKRRQWDIVHAHSRVPACLLFSSYQEGMPLTVLEALAVGIPVLASDIEQLRPLALGPLIPPRDVDAWRVAIEKILDGGAASPLSADKLTTFEETVQRTEEFYREVLSLG